MVLLKSYVTRGTPKSWAMQTTMPTRDKRFLEISQAEWTKDLRRLIDENEGNFKKRKRKVIVSRLIQERVCD